MLYITKFYPGFYWGPLCKVIEGFTTCKTKRGCHYLAGERSILTGKVGRERYNKILPPENGRGGGHNTL